MKRASWPFIALMIPVSFVAGNQAFEFFDRVILGLAGAVAGTIPGADARTMTEVPWNAWLLSYCIWILGLYIGLMVAFVMTRWPPAVWIVAALHSAVFGWIFHLLDYNLWMLPALILPFWIAYRVLNSDWVLSVALQWERSRRGEPFRRG